MKIDTRTGKEIKEKPICDKCKKYIDLNWAYSICPYCANKLRFEEIK